MTKQAIWLDAPVFDKFAQAHYARLFLFVKGQLHQTIITNGYKLLTATNNTNWYTT